MVDTKSLELSMKRWNEARGRVPQNYKDGVAGATNVIEKAIEAESTWVAAMQEAASRGSRVKGLQGTSTEEWKKAAIDKGATRIGPGMAAAEPKMREGLGKVLSVIAGVSIPARTTDGMANIDNRLKPIAAALMKMKE